jgi:PAS domain S-box-containing protein
MSSIVDTQAAADTRHPNHPEENTPALAALRAEVLALKTQLRQATEANQTLRKRLRRRQEFAQQCMRASPSSLYVYHIPRKHLVFLNDQLGALLNYTPEELQQLRPQLLKTLLHPYDRQRMKMHYNSIVKSGEGRILQAEVRLLSKEGRWKWVRVYHAVLARDAHGHASQIMGSLQDISDEKHWLKKLTWQKDFYENILNNIPAHISVFNTDHVYLFANPREIENTHINKWVIGKDDFAYCRALNRDIRVAKNRHKKFMESVKLKKEVVWEDVSITENQEKKYYLRRFYPVVNEAGNVTSVIGYSVDITQRREIELQLANEQELVRQVIESTPNPIYVKDEHGRFVLANVAYARLYGVQVEQILARQEHDSFSHRRDLQMLQTNDMVSFEEAYQQPDQTTIWLRTIKKPFVRPDGTRYLLTISSDITDLNQSKIAAEDSARAKQVFLANMSHEIRTPMNGILGLARLMKKGFITQEQTRYLDIIISSTENLLVVINDILDFAKIESGKIDLEKLPFDVQTTVEDTAKSLVFLAAEKGLTLNTSTPGAPIPTVEGDPFRLRQILVNLVTNAIKFTHAGSITIAVESRPAPDAEHVLLQFCVEDSGIGISPDKFEQIFNSFDQAYSNTSRLYGGTGLGLTICKNLVELQKGTIWLDSEVGRGSRFYFSLAYPISSAPPYEETSGRAMAPGLLQGLRVLLVEDNSVNKLLASSLLHSWEVTVDAASNGAEALRKAAAQAYDLILMDIQMPQMNGLEATDHLRQTPNPNQETPIIALTANAMKDEVESYTHLGFTDHLVKPYHELDLYRIIARTTGRDLQERSPAGQASRQAYGYNFSQLGKLASNPEFIRKMQELFIETVPAQLQQLRNAVGQQQYATANTLTHTLKSTYGNLQMNDAVQYVRQLEQVMKTTADAGQLTQLVEAVEQITERTVSVFRGQLLTT